MVYLRETGGDELKHGHLSSGVLHGNAIWAQLQVRLASHYVLVHRVIDVRVQDLLGQGHGPAKPAGES